MLELRLAGQNDLQKFSVRSFEVGKQSNRFQHGVGKVLGLVNKKDDALPSFRFAEQKVVQVRVHSHDVPILTVEAKVFHQIAKKFAGIALRLKKECAVDVALPAFEQLEQQRGLSHPRLCHQRQKSTSGLNPIEQGRQCLSVTRTKIQVPRVRSHTERLFVQLVEVEEHRLVAIPWNRGYHRTPQK